MDTIRSTPKLLRPVSSQPLRTAGSWLAYARSYKQSADLLVSDRIDSSTRASSDVEPAVIFLYRHYLELELKSVVSLGQIRTSLEAGDDGAPERVRALLNSHDLNRLTDLCLQTCIAAGMYSRDFETIFEHLASCVDELAD